MRAKQFYLCTLKEAPADAEVVSHQLMVRAGFIKRLAAGVYTHMPLGLRSLRKVEAIIREEMNAAGALELLMPAVQPAELWQESGRWVHYGPELLRIKDRHQRDFVIGPTHEEVVTDLIRRDVKSYRQLPLNVYQIQTKFRDEIRPRFGLMRGREFVMKDAYSFDATEAAAHRTYETMYAAYTRIFTRLGLNFRAVAADTGSIGGTRSHEFHVMAETGEDAIAYCPQSDYAANVELAEALPVGYEGAQGAAQAVPPPQSPMQRVATPGVTACADVATTLELPLSRVVKTLVLKSPAGLVVVLLRADHELNLIKLEKAVGTTGLAMATAEDIAAAWGPEWVSAMGYFGPVGLPSGVLEGQTVVADRSVAVMGDFACGANVADFHLTGVNWGRDVPLPAVHDVRNVVEGDPSPCGQGLLTLCRGIEVGHVFYLGTKYSKALQAEFLDETGRPTVMEMGCYGIGVTRILGAAIEQNFDDKGMIWPLSIAPFEVVVCPIGYGKSDAVKQAAETLYQSLLAQGVDVILDDRDERPGAMFADWELIGVPMRVTIGERGLKDGKAEWQTRDGLKQGIANVQNEVAIDEVLAHIQAELQHRRTAPN